MKIVRIIFRATRWPGPVTVILLVLLPWLWWRGMHTGTAQADDAERALVDLATAKSALHRDVLSARTGMLRNYDPLVREVTALHGAVDRLRAAAAGDREFAAASDRLASLAAQQEEWTEKFKSSNALLQNSLAHFGLLSARLGEVRESSGSLQQVSVLVSSLAAAILHLTLDTSPNIGADVDDRLRRISVQGLSPGDSAVAEALLAHAQLLRRLLPATDSMLRSMFAASGDQEQEAVRALVLAHKTAAETAARRIRYALCAISLLLAGMLVHLGMRLRSRAATLRQRAMIEHLIARISTRFINSPPHEITAHVERALRELATCIGADRAYFVIDGKPAQTYKWCGDGTQFPAGWPENSVTLASRLGMSQERYIHVHSVGGLAPGEQRDALCAADLRSWLCFPSGGINDVRRVLGFDTVRAEAAPPPCQLDLLSMAFDAIANAVERAFLEQDRERLEANLQQARRMETIGALASGIAHNFNNITGAILGYTETAQAQVEPTGRVAGSLNEIRRAGERARDLVDQILTFGRRAAFGRRSICIEALVAETKSLLNASLRPQINLVVRAASQETMVSGEPAQLQQVILNVCNNAAQAIDAAGTIEVHIDTKEIERVLSFGHGELEPGHYAVISIIDSGRGMDEALIERIFEPFFTTRPEGNGLGLATVREIVLDHGGAINVQSAPGAGTRFDIWLRSVSFVETSSRRETPGSMHRGSGQTVLVLDADRERLLRHEEILAALGYEPVGFTDPAEAASACRWELRDDLGAPTRFDAALLCPHLHGVGAALEHASLLRKAAPGLSMILAAPSAREFGAPALAGVGILEVIRQPLMSAELAGALARCLSVPDSAPYHLRGAITNNDVVWS
ncbi:MAG TPA: two-component system VirA-like sensor kinase [Steroidobacteraceae bacterium]